MNVFAAKLSLLVTGLSFFLGMWGARGYLREHPKGETPEEYKTMNNGFWACGLICILCFGGVIYLASA